MIKADDLDRIFLHLDALDDREATIGCVSDWNRTSR